MSINEHLWEFPHTMTLKVIGAADAPIEALLTDTLQRFLGQFDPQQQLTRLPSAKGNFVSYNARVVMQNAEQVQAIYTTLKASQHVRVVL